MPNGKLTYFLAGALVALVSVTATHAFDANAARTSGSQVLLLSEDYIAFTVDGR
jgi:hypothetical protein